MSFNKFGIIPRKMLSKFSRIMAATNIDVAKFISETNDRNFDYISIKACLNGHELPTPRKIFMIYFEKLAGYGHTIKKTTEFLYSNNLKEAFDFLVDNSYLSIQNIEEIKNLNKAPQINDFLIKNSYMDNKKDDVISTSLLIKNEDVTNQYQMDIEKEPKDLQEIKREIAKESKYFKDIGENHIKIICSKLAEIPDWYEIGVNLNDQNIKISLDDILENTKIDSNVNEKIEYVIKKFIELNVFIIDFINAIALIGHPELAIYFKKMLLANE